MLVLNSDSTPICLLCELASVLGDFATPLPQKLLLIHITVNFHTGPN